MSITNNKKDEDKIDLYEKRIETAKSLFGILPMNAALDEAKADKLQKSDYV